MAVINNFSLGRNSEINPKEVKHEHKKVIKTIMYFVQPLVILRKPITIPLSVIGKEN